MFLCYTFCFTSAQEMFFYGHVYSSSSISPVSNAMVYIGMNSIPEGTLTFTIEEGYYELSFDWNWDGPIPIACEALNYEFFISELMPNATQIEFNIQLNPICEDPNPAGCFTTGCQENYDCVDDSEYYCEPSFCDCDQSTGEWYCTEDCNGGTCISQNLKGDFNHDAEINVIDIVLIINQILELITITPYQEWASDINNDGSINILDIVQLVNIIINDEPVDICEDIDGNVYQTVQIGDQLWMAENLKVTHYNNGDDITNITNEGQWGSIDEGQYCVYNDEPANANIYGNLYNWVVAVDLRGICPEGWHVPSYEEFTQLTDFIAPEGIENWGNSVAGGKMKESGSEHWNYYSDQISLEATNESGFTGLPGGYRNTNSGDYINMGFDGFFWSSTEHSSELAWRLYLFYYSSAVAKDIFGKPNGFSIRCLKD